MSVGHMQGPYIHPIMYMLAMVVGLSLSPMQTPTKDGVLVYLCMWRIKCMNLFLDKGSQSLAGFGCVLVVGSSDQGYLSGMALGQ